MYEEPNFIIIIIIEWKGMRKTTQEVEEEVLVSSDS